MSSLSTVNVDLSLGPLNSPSSPLILSSSHPLLNNPSSPPTNPNNPDSTTPQPRVRRTRRQSSQRRQGWSPTITPPFPWATDRRATVRSLRDLYTDGITAIYGEVLCKRCEKQFVVTFDLNEKFNEVGPFLYVNKGSLNDRAPLKWQNPSLMNCVYCHQESCAKPVIADKKKNINWLFLFLGQMIGCCTLDQLKYFCKHTGNHRTGAKDRVLYLAYVELLKQLAPNFPAN